MCQRTGTSFLMYIIYYCVSFIMYGALASFERHIQPLNRVGERSYRDEVDSTFCIVTKSVVSNATA